MKVAIITADTQKYKGMEEDVNVQAIEKMAANMGFEIGFVKTLPKDKAVLSKIMAIIADGHVADLLLTIGGIDFAEEDCTSQATKEILERELPGIPEAMRSYNLRYNKRFMLTTAAAGIRKQTLIVNLPGDKRSMKESLEYLFPEIVHAVKILSGTKGNSRK